MNEIPESNPQSAQPPPEDRGASTPQRTPSFLENVPRQTLIMAVIGVLGVMILIVAVRQSAPPTTATLAGTPSASAAPTTDVAIEQERQALAKAKLTTLTHEANQAKKALSGIDEELGLWSQRVQAALTSDAGRAVSGDPAAVERFQTVYSLPRPDSADTQARRAAVSALVEGPERALSSGVLYIPDDASLVEIQRQRAWSETKLAELRRNREVAEGILKDAAAAGLRGNMTLGEAMANRQNKKAEERAAVLASEEENARQEAAQLETQARAAQIREFGKDSAAGVHTETKEKVSDSRADRYLDTTVGERERLMKLAKDPAIQAKFQPFLAKGRANIGNGFKQNYAFPKPAQFQLLQHGGALDNYEKFALAGCGELNMFGHNDRPRWARPTNDAELEEMRRRFELFKKLAPIWIELGLLQP